MSNTSKYALMREKGANPREVYLAAEAEGLDGIVCIRLLRELFHVSLAEAKEVIHTSDGSVDSLEEHQERLIPALEYAIAEWEAEEAVSGLEDEEI